MQIAGNGLRIAYTEGLRQGQVNHLMGNAGFAGIVLGTLFLLVGLAYYARAKGRSPWWCLFAFLSLIGLIVLACLEDRTWCSKVIKRDPVEDQ